MAERSMKLGSHELRYLPYSHPQFYLAHSQCQCSLVCSFVVGCIHSIVDCRAQFVVHGYLAHSELEFSFVYSSLVHFIILFIVDGYLAHAELQCALVRWLEAHAPSVLHYARRAGHVHHPIIHAHAERSGTWHFLRRSTLYSLYSLHNRLGCDIEDRRRLHHARYVYCSLYVGLTRLIPRESSSAEQRIKVFSVQKMQGAASKQYLAGLHACYPWHKFSKVSALVCLIDITSM